MVMKWFLLLWVFGLAHISHIAAKEGHLLKTVNLADQMRPLSVEVKMPSTSKCTGGDDCRADWTPVPNLGASLLGYNPFLANRLARSDPGMRSRIFVTTVQGSDGRYSVPSNIDFRDDIHCRISHTTTVATSYAEYAKMTSGLDNNYDATTETSELNLPFIIEYQRSEASSNTSKAKTSFEKDVNFFKDSRGEIYLNRADCQIHLVHMQEYGKHEFDINFIYGLKELEEAAKYPNTEKSREQLRRFISAYGTHYMSKSWLGASLNIVSKFQSQSKTEEEKNIRKDCLSNAYKNQISSGAKIKEFEVSMSEGPASISGEVGGHGGGSGTSQEITKDQCKSFEDIAKKGNGANFRGTSVISFGSYPSEDMEEWSKTAGDNPSVTKFHLRPLADLFEPRNLDGLGVNAKIVKDFFTKAVRDYCSTMLGHPCPEVKGCGITGVCPYGQVCYDDPSQAAGFSCRNDGYILLVGGMENSMEAWTPFNNNPPKFGPLPHSGFGSRAAQVEGKFYSCGGYNARDECYTTVPGRSGKMVWTAAPRLQTRRAFHTLTAVGKKLVVAGGYDAYNDKLNHVEIYQSGRIWSNASWVLKEFVADHCAVAWPGSSTDIVIIGGTSPDTASSLFAGVHERSDKVTKYNINTGRSTSLPNLPYAMSKFACCIYKGKITISGGVTDNPTGGKRVWQLAGSQWVELPSLTNDRHDHEMGVLAGELYVLGGYNIGGYKLAERFEESNWHQLPSEHRLKGKFAYGGAIVVD